MFVRREDLLRLIRSGADVTVQEAFDAMNVPLSLVPAALWDEDWFVVGHRLGHGGVSVAAALGRSQAGPAVNVVTNPELQVVTIVERVVVMAGVAALVQVAHFPGSKATTTRATVRDFRFGIAGLLDNTWITSDNAVAFEGTLIAPVARLEAGTSRELVGPWVLGGSTAQALLFGPNADAVAVDVYFTCRELALRLR